MRVCAEPLMELGHAAMDFLMYSGYVALAFHLCLKWRGLRRRRWTPVLRGGLLKGQAGYAGVYFKLLLPRLAPSRWIALESPCRFVG